MNRSCNRFSNESKGFGFIVPAEGGDDIFVHCSAIEGEANGKLLEGQTVSYEVETSPKGLQASKVTVDS